jgi:hypothetical protein
MECQIKNLITKCPLLQDGCLSCSERDENECLIERINTALEDAVKTISSEEEKEKDYVIINGLKWDKENIVECGKEYFDFGEAKEITRIRNKRLPTRIELRDLCTVGSSWDSEKNGRWFGYDHELKSGSKQSVFFPALDFRGYSNCRQTIMGNYGSYWSNTICRPVEFYALEFNKKDAYIEEYDATIYRMPVRCVSE